MPFRTLALAALAATTALTPLASLQAQTPQPPVDVTIQGHILQPEIVAPQDGMLKAPEGFAVTRFADGLVNPRWIQVHASGRVYVTRRALGDIIMLQDQDGDGRAEARQIVFRRPLTHGLFIDGDTAWVLTVKELYRIPIAADGSFGDPVRIFDDLPDAGQHPNRTLVKGPDGMLYIQVGSTCNACRESSPEHATLLRAAPDGSARTIHASGLRNTIGFGFHPVTGELWGWDHGIDWMGDDQPGEEINRIQRGGVYGWPFIMDRDRPNPHWAPPNGLTHEDWATLSIEPVLTHTAHSAGLQWQFYTGAMFPAEYRGDAFVALRGSWNRKPLSGYEVVRIRFDAAGQPEGVESFLTGFILDQGAEGRAPKVMGRPVGLGQMPDGSLLVGDDTNGVIWRVAFTGTRPAAETAAAASPAPTPTSTAAAAGEAPVGVADNRGSSLDPDESRGDQVPVPLALKRVEARSETPLEVTSPVFGNLGPIPQAYSDYGQKINPPLAIAGAPEGTQSYVIIMEDPDAKEPKPFVHWVAWNLPGPQVAAALPPDPKLMTPPQVMQGRNSRGDFGYMGPRPPLPDGPHAYHIQVFALDRMLDLKGPKTRDEVLAAMQGHVLAKGVLIGSFDAEQPDLTTPVAKGGDGQEGAVAGGGLQ